jgi:hypothetical protein
MRIKIFELFFYSEPNSVRQHLITISKKLTLTNNSHTGFYSSPCAKHRDALKKADLKLSKNHLLAQ